MLKYSNLIHNVLNVLVVVLTAAAGFDWTALLSVFGLDPALAAKIAAGCVALKLAINAIRDGLTGLIKEQPPVQ